MKMFKVLSVSFLILCFLGSGLNLSGQEQGQKSKEEQEVMKKYMAFSTPGPNHKYLESFAGEWDAVGKFWMMPGAPPTEMKQAVKAKMLMDGRYLKYSFKGDFNGMQFEGMDITGYDNFEKKFISIWIDNSGTGIYMTEGSLDSTGKIRTETGVWNDIVTGGKNNVKLVYKTVDDDTFYFEMFMSGGMYGDKEFKSMEVTYTRKK
jgi:hypothetical protein